jgi:hypothetical protein
MIAPLHMAQDESVAYGTDARHTLAGCRPAFSKASISPSYGARWHGAKQLL